MAKERILIVEDDTDIALEIRSSLEAQGYEIVDVTGSGERALDLARRLQPDLVLMDIQLEGEWDGVEAARALREQLGIAVLYMTAYAGLDTVKRAKATAPAGYLLKPFSERELIVAVDMALLRQQLETSLRAERERLNVTLRSIGDGVIATDVAGRVALLNTVAEALTGWKQEEALGRPLLEVFHIINERTRQPCEDPVKRVLETGGSVGLGNHTVLIARDGTERIISDSGAPISTAAGKIIGAVLVFRDVTRQLEIEQEMRRAQRLESVGVLAGGIAHDFNNLLTVITANVSFAVRKLDGSEPEVAVILEEVLGACERAVSLTKQLLTFAGGGAPVRKPTSLGELVRATVDFALRGSKSSPVYEIPPDLDPVAVDPGQIGQMITNLVINADEAMPAGGVIEVRCGNRRLEEGDLSGCAPGEYVELGIRDHGLGMAPEVAARLFEPYFSTKQRGSGLGLATAYSIAKRHEGALSVDSRPGEGATFRVLLPAAASPPEAELAVNTRAKRRRNDPVKGRVLVMDDERAVRAVEAVILADLGYDVEATADGAQAIRAFVSARQKGQPFDVVLLDLTVRAGMGGVETLQKLRQIDAELSAIATSGYAPDPVLAAPHRYGFVASLPKPFRKDDLGAIVERVLRQRSRQL